MIAFLALSAFAQSPDDAWRTIRTEHYRVHYPADAEAWAVPMAEHLESIRAAVVQEVGFDPPGRVPILVQDPMTTANGAAFPMLHAPRMVFWPTPPDAQSVLANYGRFDDILSVHENTHLVHMLRPSRNPLVRVLDEWSSVGPITRKAPRWVVEGYATVVEARLTGYGRPFGDARAFTLRTLAREGRLPSYGELDGNPRWGGMGDAYLIGSAFLEWLEERHGPGSLRSLWGRMTAKRERGFDVAFTGLFGESPAVLYGRFCAELAAAAVAAEKERPEQVGELFADLDRSASAPTVSADGTRIAAVITENLHEKLVVWDVAVDTETVEAAALDASELVERDPADTADSPPRGPPHERVATRHNRYRTPDGPRYLPDGDVLFTAYLPDASGRIRPDLFRWTPGRGDRRVTRHEDVANADPSPDGSWAIAVKKDFGATDLVKVDLATGDVTPFYDAPVHHVVDRPRVAPDGRVLWLENSGAGFRLRTALADGTSAADVQLPADMAIFDATFAPDGSIVASLGRDGFIDVYQVPGDGTVAQRTRSHDGTWGVEAANDGLFVLAYGTDGYDLRFVPNGEPLPEVPPVTGSAAFRAPTPEPTSFADGPVEPRAYGFGPVELRLLAGAGTGKGSASTSVGLHLGDTVGRWEALAQRTWAYNAPSGARGTFEWRGLPLDVRVGAFGEADPDHGRYGVEGALETQRTFETAEARVVVGAITDRPFPGDPLGPRWFGHGELSAWWSEGHTGLVHVGLHAAMRYGYTGDDLARMVLAEGSVGFGPDGDIEFGYGTGGSDGPSALDRFVLGGVPSAAAPDAWLWYRVTDPMIAPIGSTPLFDRMSTSLYIQGVELFVRRYRTGSVELARKGTTVTGARISFALDEQPIVRLPALDLDLGLGCQLEDPVAGVDRLPCDSVGDYTLWSVISWRP